MNLSDLVNEYKRAGYDKYRLSGGQLIDEGGQVMMNATPDDIERYKEYQHAQLAAANEPPPMAMAQSAVPQAISQPRLADLIAADESVETRLVQPDPYENDSRRLANYGGPQPEAMPAPQDPANVRLAKMMSGGTTGGWSNQNGRRTLTMQGGPRVEPPSPQKLVEQQFQQEAMRALQDPAIPMAQKIQVYQAMNKGQDLDSVMKSLQVQKLQKEISQPIPGEKPPAGYRFNGERLEAIPGGPADLKAEGRFNQDMAAMTSTEAAMNDLAAVANQLKGHSGLDDATGWQTMFPTVPGSQAANATALMDTLKAKTAFGALQAMRDASKTGGALGAVSEKELKLLESALAPLSTAQSPDEYRNALDNLIKHSEAAKSRLQGSFNMVHKNRTGMQGSPSQQAPQGNHAVVANDADYYALPKGAIYVTPDGQIRVKR